MDERTIKNNETWDAVSEKFINSSSLSFWGASVYLATNFNTQINNSKLVV